MIKNIQEIKDKSTLSLYIKKHTQVFSGNKCVCKFHNDTRPSMTIRDDICFFCCWSCNTSGDIFDYASKALNITFNEAVEEVANYFNIKVIYDKEEYNSMEIALNKLFVSGLKTPDIDTLRLFKDHNLKQETIDINELRIVDSNAYFGTGIIIPYKRNNKIVGLSCRKKRDDDPKYMHGKFNIADVLYISNLPVSKREYIIMVESPFDCMELSESGYCAVATSKTVISSGQLSTLRKLKHKYNAEILIIPDKDAAGIEALKKNILFLIENKLESYVCIPTTKNPGELKNILESVDKIYFFDYIINNCEFKLNEIIGMIKFLQVSSIEKLIYCIDLITLKFKVPSSVIWKMVINN